MYRKANQQRLVRGMHSGVCTRIVISRYEPLNFDDQTSSTNREITIRDPRDCLASSTFEHRNEIPGKIDKGGRNSGKTFCSREQKS